MPSCIQKGGGPGRWLTDDGSLPKLTSRSVSIRDCMIQLYSSGVVDTWFTFLVPRSSRLHLWKFDESAGKVTHVGPIPITTVLSTLSEDFFGLEIFSLMIWTVVPAQWKDWWNSVVSACCEGWINLKGSCIRNLEKSTTIIDKWKWMINVCTWFQIYMQSQSVVFFKFSVLESTNTWYIYYVWICEKELE